MKAIYLRWKAAFIIMLLLLRQLVLQASSEAPTDQNEEAELKPAISKCNENDAVVTSDGNGDEPRVRKDASTITVWQDALDTAESMCNLRRSLHLFREWIFLGVLVFLVVFCRHFCLWNLFSPSYFIFIAWIEWQKGFVGNSWGV